MNIGLGIGLPFRRGGVRFGPNLIANGNFDSDVAGWSPQGTGNTVSWVAGTLRATGTGAAYVQALTSFPTVVGKSYSLSFQHTTLPTVTGGNVRANLGVTASGVEITNGGAMSTLPPFVFRAISTTTYLTLRNNSATAEFFEVDNVSVREVIAG